MDPEAPPQYTEQDSSKYALQFSDATIRRRFVMKVFLLVTIMITIVALMCIPAIVSTSFQQWMQDNWWTYLIAVGVFLTTVIIISCVPVARRTFPWNFIFLIIFTLSAGFMVMMITACYTVTSVLLAFAMTAASCASIVFFAAVTTKDLTSMIGIAYILGTSLMFFGITAMIATFAFNVSFLYTVYAALACILSMFYLAIDVQLIMGGRRHELSPEEYILGALMVFLDIMNIFLFLLQIFGKMK